MRVRLGLTLASLLLVAASTGLRAQDQQPATPPPPPPPPQAAQATPPAKPLPVFKEVINIDSCLSSSQLTEGKGEICKTPAGVTVTAVMKGGKLVSLAFSDGAGRSVMQQVRPDPVPTPRCWTCTADAQGGFSCLRTICKPPAPAK